MTTKEYVKRFKLDLENYEFNREGFLKALKDEFLERVILTKESREKSNLQFTYNIFQSLVKEIQSKFWAISNKKAGKPFTKELFSAFYAMAIVDIRTKFFPEEQKMIEDRRRKIEEQSRIKEEEKYYEDTMYS